MKIEYQTGDCITLWGKPNHHKYNSGNPGIIEEVQECIAQPTFYTVRLPHAGDMIIRGVTANFLTPQTH